MRNLFTEEERERKKKKKKTSPVAKSQLTFFTATPRASTVEYCMTVAYRYASSDVRCNYPTGRWREFNHGNLVLKGRAR